MKSVGLPYSRRYDFIDTIMYWPINHMVAPKEKAVTCVEGHTPTNSRLAALGGFHMPGRDRNRTVDLVGTIVIALDRPHRYRYGHGGPAGSARRSPRGVRKGVAVSQPTIVRGWEPSVFVERFLVRQ